MKEIKVTEMPKCDICKTADGLYDGPFGGIGSSWANQCASCATTQGSVSAIEQVGFKRVIIEIAEQSEDREVYEGNDISDPMDIMSESCDREIECPKCGETRTVEIDFGGEFQCTGCGRRIHAAPLV